MLSVVIPSRTSTYLQKTINDLLKKCEGEIEIIISLDGYWPKEFDWQDQRIVVLHQGTPDKSRGMRAVINTGMAIARGKFVMKLDEHCTVDQGYDVKLAADCEENDVIIPRRYRLNADEWKIIEDGRAPVDYMYLETKDGYLHGAEWKQRAVDRADVLIDETPTFQGSCYFMRRTHWQKIGPMDDKNYGSFSNEAQEIGLKTWLSGGRVLVNKKTWYAHWHRTDSGYSFTNEQQRAYREGVKKGREYSYDYWMNNRWPERVRDFSWLVERFPEAPK